MRVWQPSRVAAALLGASVITGVVLAGGGCSGDTSLARLTEARRLSANLRVQFTKAGDAANRAVMADSDAASAAFAQEAEQTTQAVLQDVAALAPLLMALRYADEARTLEEFRGRFEEYRGLDHSILQLAIEGSNLKAQRLAFGSGRDAANAFQDSLSAVAPRDASTDRWRVQALVATAVMRVREIQVLQAPHIAEANDAAMTAMEAEMAASATGARTALEALAPLVDAASRPGVEGASGALDRFMAVNDEIVALSRRNTNVRSLALSLNQKRVITAACHDSLTALADALAKRGFTATR